MVDQRTLVGLRRASAVVLWFVVALAAAEPPSLPATGTAWQAYNTAVQTYAAGDFARARDLWTDLSMETLPRGLRHPVWFQLANAQFRLGEGLLANAPEEAVELWRRSVEADRAALALKPRDSATRHNLALIERRLAELLHRLGLESFRASEAKPRDEALNLLRQAVEQLDEAVSLAPQDEPLRLDRDRVRQVLREGFVARAAEGERRGDDDAKQGSAWSDRQAEGRYRDALEDLEEARRTGPSARSPEVLPPAARAFDQTVTQSHERVTRKLADLLARQGQREQKEGMSQREWNPDAALDQLEAALNHFQEAQAVQPGHEAAERGEREVRRAMEQLHVQEGKRSLAEGKERLAQQNPQAASSLTAALDRFQAALSLNANNVPAQNGAEEARRLLPAALARAGDAAQKAGERAETADPTEALAQYREAETDYQQALELDPAHVRAQQGLQEVEPKLARTRQRLAQEAQQASPPNRRTPSLESLLDQVTERIPPPDGDRQRQPGRNRPGDRRNLRDW